MSDFGERFDALCEEAQAAKDEGVTRVVALLAEAEAVLADLRSKGLSIRAELPLGAAVPLTSMRFIAQFGRRLA